MILVDTSVFIDYFKGRDTPKSALFNTVLTRDLPFGISPYTYQELLQGARDLAEIEMLKSYTPRRAYRPRKIKEAVVMACHEKTGCL